MKPKIYTYNGVPAEKPEIPEILTGKITGTQEELNAQRKYEAQLDAWEQVMTMRVLGELQVREIEFKIEGTCTMLVECLDEKDGVNQATEYGMNEQDIEYEDPEFIDSILRENLEVLSTEQRKVREADKNQLGIFDGGEDGG